MVNTGDILGEMNDELDGDVTTEFVTAGAKNYGYKTSQRNLLPEEQKTMATRQVKEPL